MSRHRMLCLLMTAIGMVALPLAAHASKPNLDPAKVAAARAAASHAAATVARPALPTTAPAGAELGRAERGSANVKGPATRPDPAATLRGGSNERRLPPGDERAGGPAVTSGVTPSAGTSLVPAGLRPTGKEPPPVAPEAILPRMLYAPSDPDDPTYRAEIAALTGGVVDYFDAAAGTPTLQLLASYDCVYTWANYAYFDRVAFGDVLADYADLGGKVILGGYCTFTQGNSLGGRIMTAAYCPVISPTGGNHGVLSAYAGDGTTYLHAGVLAYGSYVRDILVPQGAGIVDGHYADGEIAHAYRPDGRVVYSNGGGGNLSGTGQWPQLIANACLGVPSAPSVLYALPDVDYPLYRAAIAGYTGGVVHHYDARGVTPGADLLATYDCVYTHPNYTYSDPVLLGDRLADFVDAGGKVVLGGGCTFTGFAIQGRIRFREYCPVTSPSGTNHFTPSGYAGDGTTPIHAGVLAYDCYIRDVLVGQGAGIVDGHYTDGEIAHAYRPDGRVVYSNGSGPTFGGTGDWARLIANACAGDLATGPKMLYAPSNPDDPAYRAAIAAQTGGVVDYYDASSGTPSPALLAQYDCVYTWVNYAFDDATLFGDRLADYVDAGGKVILGAFCTYTMGYYLGGRIMTPGYCPVTSPTGDNHYDYSIYAGDGTTCFHHGVEDYGETYRDMLVTQGGGRVDGYYADGEIALAYRPDRRVIYSNGAGFALGGDGDWPLLIAALARCGIEGGRLYASTSAGELFVVDPLTGAGVLAAYLPTYGSGGCTEIEADGATGAAWLQAGDGSFFAQPFAIGSGAPLDAPIGNGASFNGLEFALDRLYGTAITDACVLSSFRTLDPLLGTSMTIGATGKGPIAGLAFEPRTSAMYGVTGGFQCGQPAELVRIDVTSGAATAVGGTGAWMGGLSFGPDGDLYAGSSKQDGGRLYRINPTTGAFALVGPTGFTNVSGLTYAPYATVAVGSGPQGGLSFAAPVPNPSGGGPVRLQFTLPAAGDARVALYDVAGRQVWQKAMGGLSAGPHCVAWDGRTSSGIAAAPGVYMAQLTTPMGSRMVRLVRLD